MAEFMASDTALRLGVDNSLPATLLPAAQEACEMLARIRLRLGRLVGQPVPTMLTSGYRCPELNAAIGSSPGSDHTMARAADIKAPKFGSAYQVA